MTMPDGWTTTSIIDATAKILDYRGRTPKKLGMDWGGGNIPALSARNVRMGRIDFGEEFYVASDALYRRWMTHGDIEQGDTLMTTEAPLGNVAAVPDSRRYILSQRTILLRPKAELFDKKFFTQVLQSPAFQRLLTQNASGSTALGIQRRKLEHLLIPAPPLGEQRRISEAISNVDDLVASLERAIVKKQAVRQGMIQQLLLDKTRLPGFTEAWTNIRLGDVLTVRHGKSQKAVESTTGKYPILATGGQIGWAETPLYSKPSVLIGRKGTIDRPQYQDQPFWTVDTLFYTEISTQADPRFLYYLFLTVDWRSMNEASGVPSLSSSRVENVEAAIPEIKEQQAIRAVLDDVELELMALESRLRKAMAIKTGMMQQLLTGDIRLPAEVVS